jgi:8-oxo-dGTP diphosphatase
MLTVVAALIESEGKLLVCQRRRGSKFELQWEFPGGKVEPGESLEAALERELQEELGVTARIGPEVHRLQHTYGESGEAFVLAFFAAAAARDEIRNLEFERIEWCDPQALPQLNFLAADRDLVAKLASGEIPLPRVRVQRSTEKS